MTRHPRQTLIADPMLPHLRPKKRISQFISGVGQTCKNFRSAHQIVHSQSSPLRISRKFVDQKQTAIQRVPRDPRSKPNQLLPNAARENRDSLDQLSSTGTLFSRLLPGPKLFFSHSFLDPYPVAPEIRSKRPIRYYLAFRDIHTVQTEPPLKPPGPPRKMKCSLQIVSTPTADTPGTTLLLHFDERRYLIGNIAEGTQRTTVQRKVGLIKVGDVFLTGKVGWDTAGGLLGLILTVADASASSNQQSVQNTNSKKSNMGGKPKSAESTTRLKRNAWLTLHGGENLTHLLATARRFIFRKGMPLKVREFTAEKKERKDWEPTIRDDCINVWDMVIQPEKTNAGTRRKRSHEEFSETNPVSRSGDVSYRDEEIKNQMRHAVVSDMFDSGWRLDALVTKKLSEVALPAAIFVRNPEGKIEKYTGPLPSEGEDIPDVDVLVRNPWPGALVDELPEATPSDNSVCYIIKSHTQRGKFDAKAATALGVKPGPLFKKLTTGESVKVENGSIVTPDMVMSPSRNGSGFAVVELPTTAYVQSLVDREEWSSAELMEGVQAIIWILGPGVLGDARIKKFMKEQKKWKHIVSSQDCCANYLALESPAAAAIRLHVIDPDRFPIPHFSNAAGSLIEDDRPYEPAKPGLVFDIEPKFQQRDDAIVPVLNTKGVVDEANADKVVSSLAAKAQAEIANPEYLARLDDQQKDIPSSDAEVITLGTGSALPSKYRNVSATMLRVPGYGSYLLDAGENTLGQLKRVFGDQTPEVLRDLKAIWISHLHADHHLGTASIIKAWAQETAKVEELKSNRLRVISHAGMTSWLAEYSGIEDIGMDRVDSISVATSRQKSFNYTKQFTAEQEQETGISSIQACSVSHCHGAAAVAITFPNGFKVAYSGDCRPSDDFVKIGQGATLLIHEATFDDELQNDAKAKKHCTTSEALAVGRKMNARRILLTHFSQRYQKIPVMDTGERDQIAIVAFDYMRVKIEDFAKVEKFKPALMKLYEDEVRNIEELGRAN
jgi:ribonuclease Z